MRLLVCFTVSDAGPPGAEHEPTVWERDVYFDAVPRIGDHMALKNVEGHAEGTRAEFVVDDVVWTENALPWLGLTHLPAECEGHTA